MPNLVTLFGRMIHPISTLNPCQEISTHNSKSLNLYLALRLMDSYDVMTTIINNIPYKTSTCIKKQLKSILFILKIGEFAIFPTSNWSRTFM